MDTYPISATVTITVGTDVEAESREDALRIARGRALSEQAINRWAGEISREFVICERDPSIENVQ